MARAATGKELIGRAMHAESLRKDRPFVELNCAAIPEDYIESELFGYRHGAFAASGPGTPLRSAGRSSGPMVGRCFSMKWAT